MLDNISLLGPDEEELSLAAVVSSATLLPSCAFSAWTIIVNIVPTMGKRAALFYLTRGSLLSIWVPVAIFIISLVARKFDDWRLYAFTSLLGLVACVLEAMRLDLHPAAVFLAVTICCAVAAIKTREV